MKRFWMVAIGLAVMSVPAVVLAGGGQGSFDGVVHFVEGRYHVRATRIPFLGLMSFISRTASHGAVAGIHVAEIESFTEEVDGDELNRIVEEKLGAGWERMIRETSRKGHEQTLIFTHPDGDRMGLFVVDLSGNEMDIVQVSVDPKHLDNDIGQYRHRHHDKDDANNAGDSDSE